MSITMQRTTPEILGDLVERVALWPRTGGPVQVHPGDFGWKWRLGGPALAEAVRVWTRDGQVVAVGLLDGDGLVRLAISPAADDDPELAARMLADLKGPEWDAGIVEARAGAALRDLLARSGWEADEPWAPLVRDLTEPVQDCGLRIEVGGAHNVRDRVEVQRAAFDNSTFTEQRWHAMAEAPPYQRARCLIGYDDSGAAVAAVTVWSAGKGRPGLLEPMGVHRDHRGRGHGRAITVAAAAALRDMGSSSATVCTPAANAGGVATYVSAGYQRLPDVTDFRRPVGG